MRNLNAAVLLLALCGGLAGLAGARDASRPSYASVAAGTHKTDSRTSAAKGPAAAAAPAAATSPAKPISSDDVALAASEFTLDVAKDVLRSQKGNAVVSALGVGVLLSLLQQGSDVLSDTSAQLERGLHLDRDTAARGLPSLLRNAITKKGSKSQLEAGNRLFVGGDSRPKSSFLKTARSTYDTEVTSVDFKQPAETAATINQWVAAATKGRIPSLVSAGSLSPRASLVMASAVYFRGVWQHTFDVGKTVQKPFSVSPAQNVTVFMMAQEGDFRAGQLPDLDAEWLEMPFDGDHFSMIMVLPNKRHGLDDVLRRMSGAHVTSMVTSQAPPRKVVVLMPRFQLNSDVSLTRTLKQLGMTAMFGRGANLRDVAEHPVAVSDIVHKAEMKVDEQGATASAASAILVNTLSLVSLSEDMKFYADQPFLAIVMDRVSKVPIFIGRISNPTTEF